MFYRLCLICKKGSFHIQKKIDLLTVDVFNADISYKQIK